MAGISREFDQAYLNRVDAGTVISFGHHAPRSLEGLGNIVRQDLIWACKRIIESATPLPDECPMASEISG
jgi:hypothetical protein